MAGTNEHNVPTSRSQAETLKVRKADGDEAVPGGSCSPGHGESGSQPVPLPGKQTKCCQHGTKYPEMVQIPLS